MSAKKTQESVATVPGGILELTLFVCGALVMIYEITGARLLAPHIGTSTYIWTSMIGVILAALSLGYWIGGQAADRGASLSGLARVLFLAGGAVTVTIFAGELLLTIIAAAPIILQIQAVLAAALLFAPAAVLLGFVTPYAVRLRISSLADSGRIVGRLYAISTIGSIVGTFLAGFYLLPFLGAGRTLYLVAGCLLVLATILAPFSLQWRRGAIVVFYLAAIAAQELRTVYLAKAHDVVQINTQYSTVQIFTSTDYRTGKPVRNLTIDPHYTQSRMYLDSDELVSPYTRYYHLIRHFRPGFAETLMIGGAGYSFPKAYLQRYPQARIEVVEIDPGMTALARRFFRLEEDPRLAIHHLDGRVYLNRAESGSYDAVLLDAFGALFSVPFQLTTVEAVRQIHRVLKDDGVVIFNIGGALTGPASAFFQAELATYRAVFPQVHVFKVLPEMADSQVQNLMLVACRSAAPVALHSPDPEVAGWLANRVEVAGDAPWPILTDDLAPVEHYNAYAQNHP
jgi:spermidine synthase